MPPALTRPRSFLSLALLFVASGCTRENLVSSGYLQSTGIDADAGYVTMTGAPATRPSEVNAGSRPELSAPPPTVIRDGDRVLVNGSISRKNAGSPLKGSFYLMFQTPDGSDGQPIPLVLAPAEIPPGGASTYQVAYGVVPPKGTTVSVFYSDLNVMTAVGGAAVSGAPGAAVGMPGDAGVSVGGAALGLATPAPVRAAPKPAAPTPNFGFGGLYGSRSAIVNSGGSSGRR